MLFHTKLPNHVDIVHHRFGGAAPLIKSDDMPVTHDEPAVSLLVGAP
jgi:hypothetical protein